jgi:hypothetical protein
MNKKEELQVEKPSTKTQALKAIFQRESGLKQRIKKAYMQDLFAQRHFKKLGEQKKVKNITLKEGLLIWK